MASKKDWLDTEVTIVKRPPVSVNGRFIERVIAVSAKGQALAVPRPRSRNLDGLYGTLRRRGYRLRSLRNGSGPVLWWVEPLRPSRGNALVVMTTKKEGQ